MKRFGALVTICFIVLSTLTPLWGVSHVRAEDTNLDMSDVFPKIGETAGGVNQTLGRTKSGDYVLSPTGVSITAGTSGGKVWQPTSKDMLFNITLTLPGETLDSKWKAGPAQDTSKDGKFGPGDYFGSWDTIFDDSDDDVSDDGSNGVFLVIQKLKNGKKAGGDNDPKWTIVTKANEPKDSDLATRSVQLQFASFPNSDIVSTSIENAKNIGHFLFNKNPDQFFGKTQISFQVAVTDLDPSSEYVALVHLSEDGQYDDAISEPYKFTTDLAGAVNKNQEEIGDVSTSATGSEDTNNATPENTIYGQKIGCSFGIVGESDWTGCFIQLYWNTLYTFSAWVLRGAAGLMDTFMAISLSSAMYKNSFIETGWTVVRDVCNIFFIFILLWTAFKMVINSHHYNAQKTIVNIVIIGLLINFSLFFSRVIIDMGNISARVFYNQIRITGGEAQNNQDAVAGAINTKDIKPKAISGALADGLSFGAINTGGYEKINKDKGLNYGTIFLLITLNIIVNLVAMWVFIKVAFAFMGRVLSLWVGMIMSPFAFTSTIVEDGHGGMEGIGKIGWTAWLKNMLEAAFYPSLYLFFIFLIIILIQSNFAGAIIVDINTLNSTPFLIMTLFKFMFIIGLLIMSAEFAKKMSGTFGGGLTDFVGKAAGFLGGAAVGVATGGLAMAGSKVLGSRAAATLAGEKGNALRSTATSSLEQLRANPANTGKTDAQLLKMQDKAKEKLLSLDKKANSSYDLRQTKVFGVNPMQGLSNVTGLNFNAGTAGTRLGVDSTAGGYQASKDRKAAKDNEKDEKFKKLLGDKTVNYNGVMMTQDEAQKKSEEMKQDIADHEETKKNDPGIKNIEDELERIEKAIKDNKDSGGPQNITAGLVAQRQAERQNLADRKQVLNDAFKTEMVAKHGALGVSPTNSIEKVSSELGKEARKAKDGYHKDYIRNKIFERQREVGGLEDHHHNSTANLFRKQFWSKDNLARITASMGAGALAGGVVAGPLGAIVGTVAGAFGGGRLSSIQGLLRSIDRKLNTDISGARSYGAATHDIAAGHVHAPHGHADYHTPHGASINKLFASIAGGTGGGSSGGGSHGGGDHGHGGGGGHH